MDKEGDEALISRASLCQKQKDWKTALEIWTAILQKKPNYRPAVIQKANCLLRLQRYQQAIKTYRAATQKWPEYHVGYLGLIKCNLRLEQMEQTLTLLFAAVQKFPQEVQFRVLQVLSFIQLRQTRVASEFLDRAKMDFPNNLELNKCEETLAIREKAIYNNDGLISEHNHDFVREPDFREAYARGLQATDQENYDWYWRVHIGLWVAHNAFHLDGDFVECGVNKGFLSSSIMHKLNWNQSNKKFYLLDSFEGLNLSDLSFDEQQSNIIEKNETRLNNGYYNKNVEKVRENFSEWPNAIVIKGYVPETLIEVTTEKIAYLHIDMNADLPSGAALDQLWNKLIPGAYVLMDDYASKGYDSQKKVLDTIALKRQHKIVSFPTGQGLLIKRNQI